MRKRRVNIVNASISLLDLLSCAFGAVLVLSALFSALIKAKVAAGQDNFILVDCFIKSEKSINEQTQRWLKNLKIGFQLEFPSKKVMKVWPQDKGNTPYVQVYLPDKDIPVNSDPKVQIDDAVKKVIDIRTFYSRDIENDENSPNNYQFSTLILDKVEISSFGKYTLSIFCRRSGEPAKIDFPKKMTFYYTVRYPKTQEVGAIEKENNKTFEEFYNEIKYKENKKKSKGGGGPILQEETFYVSL